MKARQILIGCGIAALLAAAVLFAAAYSGSAAFFKYGVSSDLSEYRDSIRKMDIDAKVKEALLNDLEEVRFSLDEKNNFGFFQWLEIDDSIQGILADGMIETSEFASLLAEIARMKKIQGIAMNGTLKHLQPPELL